MLPFAGTASYAEQMPERLTKRGRRMTRHAPFSARVRVRLPGEHHDRVRKIRVR